MANLCVQYLNFKCFENLHNADSQTNVAAGAYAFQEYATRNWIYHTQLVFDLSTSYTCTEFASLKSSCLLLKLTHGGLPSEQQRVPPLQNTDQENQDFQAGMSVLRKDYEGIYSISDSEGLSSV